MTGSLPTLIDRRDIVRIKRIAAELVTSPETLTTGDGTLSLVPVSLLLQLRDAFGDDGMGDVFAVIDGPALRSLRDPAGLRSMETEMAALSAVEERRRRRAETDAEREANERARSAGARMRGDDPQPVTAYERMTGGEAKAIRDRLGLSTRQFAAALGISVYTVNNWMRQEKDRHDPTPESTARIRALVAEREGA